MKKSGKRPPEGELLMKKRGSKALVRIDRTGWVPSELDAKSKLCFRVRHLSRTLASQAIFANDRKWGSRKPCERDDV
jgi:hypothetical protein